MMSDESNEGSTAASSTNYDPAAVPPEGEGSWASFGESSGPEANDDAFDQESPPMATSLPGVDDRDVVMGRSDTGGHSLEDVPVEGKMMVPHGDLPDPETIPRDPAHVAKIKQRKKRALMGAAGLIVVCVLVIVCVSFFGPGDAAKTAVPGVTGTASGGGSGGGGAGDEPHRPPPPETPEDQGEDTGGGGEDQGDEDQGTEPEPEEEEDHDSDAARLQDAESYILKNGISKGIDLDDIGTPQRLALEWICVHDPYKIPIPHHFLNNDDTWGVVDHSAGMKFVQRYSLAVLYFALGGTVNQDEARGWKTTLNMMGDVMECDWNERYKTSGGGLVDLGVICDGPAPAGDGDWMRVTKIWIPWDHKLTGTLPPEIRHLTDLTSISMAYQSIEGIIPPEVCALADLEELSLSNNVVTGSLPPCLDQMTSLRILALDDNVLTGSLDALEDADALEFVYLEDNGFEHTLGMNSLTKLTNLVHLDLSDNKLKGSVPSHFFDSFTNLRVLDLHDNELTGEFPSIEEQDTLEFLALHKNKMSGKLGKDLGNLKGLVYLDLAHNQFTGTLEGNDAVAATEGIGTLTDLKYLFIGGNQYDAQEIPFWLSNMTDLLELSLKDSSLLGQIPSWIGNLNSLYLLDLDGNILSGAIPPQLGQLTDLLYLLLNRNELTGEVPPAMSNLVNLQVLLLDDNDLSGSLDDSGLCAAISNETDVAADCAGSDPEISCDSACCTICCEDDGEPCNDDKWIANNDPIWEHRYGRYRFVFENDAN